MRAGVRFLGVGGLQCKGTFYKKFWMKKFFPGDNFPLSLELIFIS